MGGLSTKILNHFDKIAEILVSVGDGKAKIAYAVHCIVLQNPMNGEFDGPVDMMS